MSKLTFLCFLLSRFLFALFWKKEQPRNWFVSHMSRRQYNRFILFVHYLLSLALIQRYLFLRYVTVFNASSLSPCTIWSLSWRNKLFPYKKWVLNFVNINISGALPFSFTTFVVNTDMSTKRLHNNFFFCVPNNWLWNM